MRQASKGSEGDGVQGLHREPVVCLPPSSKLCLKDALTPDSLLPAPLHSNIYIRWQGLESVYCFNLCEIINMGRNIYIIYHLLNLEDNFPVATIAFPVMFLKKYFHIVPQCYFCKNPSIWNTFIT